MTEQTEGGATTEWEEQSNSAYATGVWDDEGSWIDAYDWADGSIWGVIATGDRTDD